MKTLLLIFLSLFAIATYSQNTESKFNFGVSLGIGGPTGLPNNLYPNNGFNVGFHLAYQIPFKERWVGSFGLAYQNRVYGIDAVVNGNQLTLAPDSIKYGTLNQHLIQVPIFIKRYDQTGKHFYLLGIIPAYTIKPTYKYRYAQKDYSKNLTEANAFSCDVVLGLGNKIKEKGQMQLNFFYTITPFFTGSNSTKFNQLGLQWVFLL